MIKGVSIKQVLNQCTNYKFQTYLTVQHTFNYVSKRMSQYMYVSCIIENLFFFSTMSPFGLSQSNSILYGIRHCENIGSSPTLNDAMCPGGTICTGSLSGMAASKDANVMPLPCALFHKQTTTLLG